MSEHTTDDYDCGDEYDPEYDDEEVKTKIIEYTVKFERKVYIKVPEDYPDAKVLQCQDVLFELQQPEDALYVDVESKPHIGAVPRDEEYLEYSTDELDEKDFYAL